ncbi:hypothetical protein [Achromobacter sp. 2789STDY5608621]|uniref:hypothetical protein n=1 Tax=Achromobacter sp. 2789STDY5608621 TaxID=1806496 RepID=UPI0006C2E483|nr:hypothetical protein [Achromobacter sp. 2789STDY5608621]CUI86526.1 Uncharacterised protein [Achromobacter sp. 2789STDY5608621]
MRERPILFTGPMVRAILAGNKTQTRRVVKLPHTNPLGQWEPTTVGGPGVRFSDGTPAPEQPAIWHTRTGDALLCPYGQPGDRLWVREAFRFAASLDRLSPNDVGEKALDAGYNTPWAPTQFEADGRRAGAWHGFDTPPTVTTPGKLRPGIHMPRWACRLVLEITGVRVERLNDISEEDARAEGCPFTWDGNQYEPPPPEVDSWQGYGRASFSLLWSQINGPESWNSNPWVWVVEFRRADTDKKEM